MYVLSQNQINQVSGGCPICAISGACIVLGTSTTVLGLTTNQFLIFALGGVILTTSLFYVLKKYGDLSTMQED